MKCTTYKLKTCLLSMHCRGKIYNHLSKIVRIRHRISMDFDLNDFARSSSSCSSTGQDVVVLITFGLWFSVLYCTVLFWCGVVWCGGAGFFVSPSRNGQ